MSDRVARPDSEFSLTSLAPSHLATDEIKGTPTLQQLLKALKKLDNWYVFGAILGVPISQLKKIKSYHQSDIELCKIDMLQYWLDNKFVSKWSDVILALEETDQLALAAQIKHDYLWSPAVSEEEGVARPDPEFSPTSSAPSHLATDKTKGTPTLQQLLETLKTVENWFVFGAMLGVPVPQLKKIKSSCQGDIDLCKIEMLQYWLDNKLVPKWNDVILALEETDQLVLAAQIKRDYLLSAAVSEKEERQQLEADIERLTSDKADLLTRLQCCEEDLKSADELLTMRDKAISSMMAAVHRRDTDVEEREERISHLKKELKELRREGVESSVTQTSEERTNPIEVLNPISTVDSAVQANYLAVAPDFLRGVEVCGETVLEVVGDKPQKVEWPGYGFYVEVPEGALPPGVTASVGVKVILAGQFKLPENKLLISAFYWVSSSEVFLKEVAVNIQHCAFIRSEEQCSVFKFIIAKCSQKELPYTFKERDGLFNSHTQYATIKLKQFSIMSAVAPLDTKICCAAFMYYKQRTAIPPSADFHFVLVMDLPPQIQEVERKYKHWKEDNSLCICLEENENGIKLDLKQQKLDSWEIVPLTAPQITRDDVTKHKKGTIIPHCAFECQLFEKATCKQIRHKVDIIGVTTEDLLNYFHIRYIPYTELPEVPSAVATPPLLHPAILPPAQLSSPTDEAPNKQEFLNVVASRALDRWDIIGLQLSIEEQELNTIEHYAPIRRFSKLFDLWKNKGTPPFTWTTILDALRSPAVGANDLARDVEAAKKDTST